MKVKSVTTLFLICAILIVNLSYAEKYSAKETMNQFASNGLVIIGASYVHSWNLTIENMVVINKGVDGEESHQVADRFDKDAIDLKPEYVLIWGFINDIHRNPKDKIDATLERAKNSIKEMVRKSIAHDITPIVVTETTVLPKDTYEEKIMGFISSIMGKKSYQDFVNNNVLKTNRWLVEYAKENNIRYIDFNRLLAAENGIRKRKFSTKDGTHINKIAYEQLTKATQALFKKAR